MENFIIIFFKEVSTKDEMMCLEKFCLEFCKQNGILGSCDYAGSVAPYGFRFVADVEAEQVDVLLLMSQLFGFAHHLGFTMTNYTVYPVKT